MSQGKKRNRSDYDNLPLSVLKKLISERGLKQTTNKAQAIIKLEAYDDNIIIDIPKLIDVEEYKPVKFINTATLNYIDPNKPFFGISLDIVKLIGNRLHYYDRLNLALTCKRFYTPIIELICSSFLDNVQHSSNTFIHMQNGDSIFKGKGITPMAVACYEYYQYLSSIGDYRCSSMWKVLDLINKHGTIDHAKLIQKAKEYKSDLEYKNRIKRANKLNNELIKHGYNGDETFRMAGRHQVVASNHIMNMTSENCVAILAKYIRHAIEFDWNKLPEYFLELENKCLIERK